MEKSIQEKKVIIPILLSSFHWEGDPRLVQLKQHFLPTSEEPVDSFPNIKKVFSDIIETLCQQVLGNKEKVQFKNDRPFYYVLALLVFVMGTIATIMIYSIFQEIVPALLVFLLFCCIILFILKNVIFPTSISSLK